MQSTTPEHETTWVRELVVELDEMGLDVGQLLRDAGIHDGQLDGRDVRLPFDKVAAVFERAAELSGDDLLGFRFAQKPELIRKGGVTAYLGLSSPDVGSYIRVLARYERVVSDGSEVIIDDLETSGMVHWHFGVSAAVRTRQYGEFGSVGTIHTLRKLTNRNIRPLAVEFAHVRNENVDAFRKFFGCAVTFGTGKYSMQLKERDLRLPLKTSDDDLLNTLQAICEDVLKRNPDGQPALVTRVERLIADRLSSGEIKQSAVASELGVSGRTLARRLSDEGTNFLAVLEELRLSLADDYLKHSNLPLTEIAFLLGYQDASSFSTAYRRWTGDSPRSTRGST